jgi:RecJ-like exonuclease
MKQPLVVNHYDCDGLASGSIALAWLQAQRKPFRIKTIRKLDAEFANSISKEEEIIFVDLGSGSPFLDELGGSVVIIDHHQVACKSHLQANPHLFGFDGGSEISASGCAYFTFRTSADLGIVGAVGDIQYPLKSLNRIMLDEAVEKKEAAYSTDLMLFGRNSRPLIQLLSFADDPYLPGLTGNDEACARFLFELGIPLKQGEEWRTYSSLSEDEKKRLVSALAELLAARVSPEAAERLTGEVYTFLLRPQGTELSDAHEFSTLLNACGRNRRPELGMDVCLGKPGAYEEAKVLLAQHRKNLREGIEFALKNVQDLGKFLLIDGRGAIPDSIIGVIAGMVFPGTRSKPILALSFDDEGAIKVSTRGTRKLVEGGLNLGRILSESCAAVGGVGGGHNIAAGATIPANKLEDFLKEFSSRI